MKLYSRSTSPYAARVLASLALKDLAVELLEEPAGGLQSAEFLAINPQGKVPVLVLDSGEAIAESLVIQEYLEDHFAQRPLYPADPLQKARMRVAGRVLEQRVDPSLLAVVMLVASRSDDREALGKALAGLSEALRLFSLHWQPGPYAFGSQPTLLDAQLLPVMTYLQLLAGATGVDLLADFPALAAYQEALADDPQLSPVAAGLAGAVLARLGAA